MIFFLSGIYQRGEVWWVCVDDSVGHEIQTGRPAVIVSASKANEKRETVIVAFITSQGKPHPHNVRVYVEGEFRRVMCDTIRTVSKERLTRCICTLTEPEMIRVTGGLACAMCIPNTGKKEESPKDETPDVLALRAESDMWKGLYERAMAQLVEMKLQSDIALRMTQRVDVAEPVAAATETVEATEPPKEEPQVEFEETPEKVDLNSCTPEDLKKCGCNATIAGLIIAGRPYTFVEDLRRIPGITNVAYRILECKVCVVPVEEPVEEPVVAAEVAEPEEPEEEVVAEAAVVEPPVVVEAVVEEKVNINTATAREIWEKLGVSKTAAYAIIRYRKENGLFVSVEELLETKVVGKPFYQKYKDRLTIGEPEPKVEKEPDDEEDWLNKVVLPQPQPEEEAAPTEKPKVNVNTASTTDLMKVGFSKSVAGRINAHVRKFGPYRDLDELLEIEGMRGKTLRKLRDKLEV